MKTIPSCPSHPLALATLLLAGGLMAQDPPSPAAVNGVQEVKQQAVQSVKNAAPPTVVPVTPPPPTGVTQPVPPPPPAGVMPPPPPPPATQSVNQVDGVQAAATNAVKGVPPPPAAAVSSIRAVQGVQGIVAPRRLNLEAALLMKEGGNATPAGGGAEGGQGKAAAAAALLNGPKGLAPAPPAPAGDSRAALQEFEKLDKPGS